MLFYYFLFIIFIYIREKDLEEAMNDNNDFVLIKVNLYKAIDFCKILVKVNTKECKFLKLKFYLTSSLSRPFKPFGYKNDWMQSERRIFLGNSLKIYKKKNLKIILGDRYDNIYGILVNQNKQKDHFSKHLKIIGGFIFKRRTI